MQWAGRARAAPCRRCNGPSVRRAPAAGPPVRLIGAHWHGDLVRPADLIVVVNAAKPGARIVSGVCDCLPAGTLGLLVPDTISVSIRLRPGSACALDSMEIKAPAADARGLVRVQPLLLVRLGKEAFPLIWQFAPATAPIPATASTVVSAAVFARFVQEDQWIQFRANPSRALQAAIWRIRGLDRIAIIDVWDFARTTVADGDRVSCKVRVISSAVDFLLCTSGQDGLLIRDLLASGSVQWGKPGTDERHLAFLDRMLRLSEDKKCHGLAFSNKGSLGLRRQAGEATASYAAVGFPRSTPRSTLASWLSDLGWRDVEVGSTTNRGDSMRAFFRAKAPLTQLQAPWSYTTTDNATVLITHWMPIARPVELERLGTPPLRWGRSPGPQEDVQMAGRPAQVDFQEDVVMDREPELQPRAWRCARPGH